MPFCYYPYLILIYLYYYFLKEYYLTISIIHYIIINFNHFKIPLLHLHCFHYYNYIFNLAFTYLNNNLLIYYFSIHYFLDSIYLSQHVQGYFKKNYHKKDYKIYHFINFLYSEVAFRINYFIGFFKNVYFMLIVHFNCLNYFFIHIFV